MALLKTLPGGAGPEGLPDRARREGGPKECVFVCLSAAAREARPPVARRRLPLRTCPPRRITKGPRTSHPRSGTLALHHSFYKRNEMIEPHSTSACSF